MRLGRLLVGLKVIASGRVSVALATSACGGIARVHVA